jgi:choline kinase
VYNERYDQTNTSKSLLRALKATGKGGVLWMNGDVVFDPRVLGRAIELIERDQSFVTRSARCTRTRRAGTRRRWSRRGSRRRW